MNNGEQKMKLCPYVVYRVTKVNKDNRIIFPRSLIYIDGKSGALVNICSHKRIEKDEQTQSIMDFEVKMV